MKKQSNLIFQNLSALRQYHKYSQEEVAEKVGVSRQAVAKWESGETVPDILNCNALAELYDVSLDSLIHYDQEKEHMPIPPKGKHLFGTVKGMVGSTCRIQKDQACRIDCNRNDINPVRLMSCLDKQRDCCEDCHEHPDKMGDRAPRIFNMFF